MRIAVFDYKVTPNSPIGSCNLRLIESLRAEHEITVFAVECAVRPGAGVTWVRIPAPTRPLALLFLAYLALAPLYYAFWRMRQRVRFDVLHVAETYYWFGDVSYSQFCHRFFLANCWTQMKPTGIRARLRWLDHWLRRLSEPRMYRRAKTIVVPSHGLAAEIARTYPSAAAKLQVIPNPVDVQALRVPAEFDRIAFRHSIGLRESDTVLAFVALGHFERKGLPLLLEALRRIESDSVRLLVVGGEADVVSDYRRRAGVLGLANRVTFAGPQRDVRPYYWAADGFVFPSFYETFSLVCFQAAAAGLPLLVTRLSGVEDVLRDGLNGILLDRTAEGIEAGIRRFLELAPAERSRMGARARTAVEAYDVTHFIAAWQAFYAPPRDAIRKAEDALHPVPAVGSRG